MTLETFLVFAVVFALAQLVWIAVYLSGIRSTSRELLTGFRAWQVRWARELRGKCDRDG